MYARCSISVAASENCHAMYEILLHILRQDKFIASKKRRTNHTGVTKVLNASHSAHRMTAKP